ncbi:Uncharacterised protein [BD1-7 clade bacterium]|uniref:Uncharacterized protein n=1 Tax=BD1-7 clade bacterium TaxID=2029982 RepID=A0A5S9QRW4_9GAMM|nr:Uncharacterised protein [BD1-7 clade bacterium]
MKKLVFALLVIASTNCFADQAWRCTKDTKVVRIFLANLQPDIAIPCEVRVEIDGIIHRLTHEEVDPKRCVVEAKNTVERYNNQGFDCAAD